MELPESINDLNNLEVENRRRVWQFFMEKYNCQKIAEVGVFQGQNFKRMIAHNPELAVGVDVWREEGIAGQNDADLPQEELDAIYRHLEAKYIGHKNVKIIRDYTVQSASLFPDEFFDLVYIDANHEYSAVKDDINAWYKKVRSGGFVTGDDYWDRISPKRHVRFGVVRAVNEFAEKNRLTVYPLNLHGWCILK